MGPAQPVQRFSVAEYYALEESAEYRSEFFEGEIFAMAGGSACHSLISANLLRELGNRLKGKPCAAYESNLRLKIDSSGLRTYPELRSWRHRIRRHHWLHKPPEDLGQYRFDTAAAIPNVLCSQAWQRLKHLELRNSGLS